MLVWNREFTRDGERIGDMLMTETELRCLFLTGVV
jgi:hypothetical protein